MKKINEDSSPITFEKIESIAEQYGLTDYIYEFEPKEILLGYNVELEHKRKDDLNVVHNDGDVLKICLTHLLEIPDYYALLKKMESRVLEQKENTLVSIMKESFMNDVQRRAYIMTLKGLKNLDLSPMKGAAMAEKAVRDSDYVNRCIEARHKGANGFEDFLKLYFKIKDQTGFSSPFRVG
jgi:hypothetical protein